VAAVCAALAIASSGPSPHRSVSVNRASALTVTARSRLSWANTFTPDLYVRYFRDLGQMIADGQPLTPESTEQAMSRYATETLS
jgi:hypothetical protein